MILDVFEFVSNHLQRFTRVILSGPPNQRGTSSHHIRDPVQRTRKVGVASGFEPFGQYVQRS